ncbi:MAG: Undecaprenyl-phosphate galactose phosphotransferase [candidate division WWE3 bacterium GW2011_GWA1_46_21]|uniref:Undecaprenyl-phosphate galactose phosphotransferase n=4 Tax=Katanobacteria TaxID=422282 RepID=A0A0G1SBX6_UNCKA|nr:MAG: Undecaprenyl-phosphate galactose phosphotransferase [candidate division WWE3 bacterium GW2011_GWA1_46_21]KKU49011.1 MAG: Undecaprenyl-phosphate galactose phosphotransferase [candidate division WWE3 bacterium GW2011_GWA2_46_9]KKU51022.1 MAG: Undecaprenyl-phosphate galactose phosphotransferase [candidate division WWE3 bacterium GW2011_GWC1_47_10]KKU58011.1 MAG: Undecaprenyl-phosphate galactose phosphotransferase [candidate division WWE3 bacterium GW2011_GWB1_47_11]
MTFYDVTKRIIDVVGALVGVVIFSPVMVAIAIWIKIVSPEGSVFADIPQRVGRHGRNFRFYKFRSMIPNALQWLRDHPELYKKYQENGYKLGQDEDPRLIPGAKFLRKSSIDEFPQFFNVLRGEMSLVGPRAYFPFEVEEQTKRFPETAELMPVVLSVNPGITGIWQISGRSEITFPERVRMDADYAKRRSLLYDLVIMLKTPLVVLGAKGAY